MDIWVSLYVLEISILIINEFLNVAKFLNLMCIIILKVKFVGVSITN